MCRRGSPDQRPSHAQEVGVWIIRALIPRRAAEAGAIDGIIAWRADCYAVVWDHASTHGLVPARAEPGPARDWFHP